MKRSLKFLSLVVAFLLVLTGCSTKSDPEKQLKDALEKTSKITSANEKFTADVSMKESGKDISANLEGDFDVYNESDEKSTMHGNLKVSSQGMSYSAEGYFDIDKTNIGAYVNIANTWIKFEQKLDDDTFKKLSEELKKNNESVDFMKFVKDVKSEKSDSKDVTKLVVTIDKDKFNSEIKNAFEKSKDELKKESTVSDDELKEVEEMANKGLLSADISFNVYIKDGYISKFEWDLSDFLKNVTKATGASDEDMKKFDEMELKIKFTVELSKFNSVEKITIPDAAKNGKSLESLMNDPTTGSLFSSMLGM